MIDFNKLLTIGIEGAALISAFAAIAASVIIFSFTKKLQPGVFASAFKSISFGIFFIALGILVDAIQSYLVTSNFAPIEQYITLILLLKLIFFIIGTYIIVIGSKKTGDKLKSISNTK